MQLEEIKIMRLGAATNLTQGIIQDLQIPLPPSLYSTANRRRIKC